MTSASMHNAFLAQLTQALDWLAVSLGLIGYLGMVEAVREAPGHQTGRKIV